MKTCGHGLLYGCPQCIDEYMQKNHASQMNNVQRDVPTTVSDSGELTKAQDALFHKALRSSVRGLNEVAETLPDNMKQRIKELEQQLSDAKEREKKLREALLGLNVYQDSSPRSPCFCVGYHPEGNYHDSDCLKAREALKEGGEG
jgi:hypothetical protein